MDIRNGNCLELLKTIPDKSVDLFLCDLPYGETNCKWDTIIDMEEFWKEFKRVRKSKKTACIHFCSTKFGYKLINSWEQGFKMDMVWKKRNKTGGLQSRYRPMRNHEMVYFFHEQAPKYNRDKYHKRIQSAKIVKKDGKNAHGFENNIESGLGRKSMNNFEPPNPASVVEEKKTKKTKGKKKEEATDIYGETKTERKKRRETDSNFKPPNPASVVEEQDYVFGDATSNKLKALGNTHGTNSFEPPNPASVVEEKPRKDENYYKDADGKDTNVFSKKAWKGTPLKLKKDMIGGLYDPLLPTSVVEEKEGLKLYKNTVMGDMYLKKEVGAVFEPPNPASVVEEKYTKEYLENKQKVVGTGGSEMKGIFTKENQKEWNKTMGSFDPPNPASVVEEETTYGITKEKCLESRKNGFGNNGFEPPNPASVINEHDPWGMKNGEHKGESTYKPPNPASVLEDEFIEPAEDEPKSMFESTKVFIGKRNHQTEKPQDILEFFLKYYTDENDVVLDPTMGSGSTGVACKTLNRKFIGFELDKKIFEVAKNRIEKAIAKPPQ